MNPNRFGLFCSLILLISVTFTTACLQTRGDIKEAEGRRATQETVTTMQRTAADQATRFQEIETSARELNGRIEVLENKINLSEQNHLRSQKAVEDQLTESNKKVSLLQEEITQLQAQVNSLSQQVAQSDFQAKSNDDDKKSSKSDKKNTFEIAEEHFQKKEWKKAILSYQKYRDANPKAKKTLEATYKIGVCFQELGLKDEAKSFYEELIAKSPKSDEARRARIRLKKLK